MRRTLTKKSQRAMARSGTAICPTCNTRRLLVEHHINGREVPDWDKPWNRAYICAGCHDEVHNGDLVIIGYVRTTEGKVLEWHRVKIVLDSGEGFGI